MKPTIKKLFGTDQPMIALLHLDPLPGDPTYPRNGSMDSVVENARKDLKALQRGGVDGILISNEFSLPYLDEVEQVTSGAMGYVIGQLKKDITVPFGVHVIADPIATLDVAAAVEADFVRGVFSGTYAGDVGLREYNLAKIIRRKRELGLDDLLMFFMINAESDPNLSGRDIGSIAKSVDFKYSPDGMCVSGIQAGHGVDQALLDTVKAAVPKAKVYANTGCNKDTIKDMLTFIDGGFVGTTFKKDGKFENHVDYRRVKAFMDIVKANRKK